MISQKALFRFWKYIRYGHIFDQDGLIGSDQESIFDFNSKYIKIMLGGFKKCKFVIRVFMIVFVHISSKSFPVSTFYFRYIIGLSFETLSFLIFFLDGF